MGRILLEERMTVGVEATATEGIVCATYSSPTETFSCYIESSQLQDLTDIVEARSYMLEYGMIALTEAGMHHLTKPGAQPFLTAHILNVQPRSVSADQLVLDHRAIDGFAYRYNYETPVSTPIRGAIRASDVLLTNQLVTAIANHDWTTLTEDGVSVHNNDSTLRFEMLLPQQVFDEMYLQLREQHQQYLTMNTFWSEIIVRGAFVKSSGDFDLLHIHHLMYANDAGPVYTQS